jgi:hypothetical protein
VRQVVGDGHVRESLRPARLLDSFSGVLSSPSAGQTDRQLWSIVDSRTGRVVAEASPI